MPRIMVIDDDPTMLTFISGLLEASCHSVVVAQDGRAGIKAFETDRFDLVITDIVMPEQEGIATIGALRRLSPTVPIVAISASRTVGRYGDYLHAAKLLGANVALAKPFTADALMEIVGRLLASPGPGEPLN
ncbi:MAG: two-component response regulator [Rhodospirillales bacterium]|nr:two-component response regulator [Rhodospirillales bacterium]